MLGSPQQAVLEQYNYDALMQHRRGTPNDPWLAQMYVAYMHGETHLSLCLGLPLDIFRSMMDYHFPTLRHLPLSESIQWPQSHEVDELQAIRAFLQTYLDNPKATSGGWLVEILAAGCLGKGSWWQALGLWSEQEFHQLLQTNFSRLAEQAPLAQLKTFVQQQAQALALEMAD